MTDQTDARPGSIEHTVSEYDSQRDEMTLVAGWQIQAQAVGVTGRKFGHVLIAICPSKDDADEIAKFLNEKYAT